MKDMICNVIRKTGDFMKKYEFCHIFQFAVVNGFIWMLMSIAYLCCMDLQKHSGYGITYSVLFTVGHIGVFSCGLWMLLQLCRFCGKRFFRVSTVFWGGLLTFLLFADIVVFSLYRFHINIPMLALFCSPAAFELVELPVTMILMIVLIAVIIFAGEFFLWKLVRKFSLAKSSFAVFGVIILCFLGFNGIHAWAAFNADQEIMLRTEALPLKYAMTATRFFSRLGFTPAKRINIYAGSVINYPLKKLEFNPVAKRKNVIFILVDSLRADMLTPEVMPNMCSLAEKVPSALFTNHFSGGNCTKTGVFSLFYGIPGNYFDQALRSNVGAAMIDSMKAQGYDIKVFAGATLLAPPFNRTIFANVPDIEVRQPGATKVERDISAINKCVEYLQKRDSSKPCFIFLFLDSVHGSSMAPGFPQKFPTELTQVNYLNLRNNLKGRSDVMNLIRNSCFYMDDLLHRFFRKVDMPKRIAEDTVVLLTSDHGNEVGESEMKNWGHNSNFARYQTQTPLLIFGLDRPTQKITYQTSAMDVSATIMQDLLGCKNDIADYSIGRNLFDPTEREFIFSSSYLETAIINRNKVFVQTVYGIIRKYDLDGKFIEDPLPAPVVKKFFEMTAKYAK